MRDVYWVTIKTPAEAERVETLRLGRCNSMTYGTDKTGARLFKLGYDAKPDSDWGKYYGDEIIVRALNDEAAALVDTILLRRLNLGPRTA